MTRRHTTFGEMQDVWLCRRDVVYIYVCCGESGELGRFVNSSWFLGVVLSFLLERFRNFFNLLFLVLLLQVRKSIITSGERQSIHNIYTNKPESTAIITS